MTIRPVLAANREVRPYQDLDLRLESSILAAQPREFLALTPGKDVLAAGSDVFEAAGPRAVGPTIGAALPDRNPR